MSIIDNPMDLSFIIVNYRSKEHTLNCIRSILALKHAYTLEIIIADNSPEDNLKTALPQAPKIKYICLKKNLGFAKAINRGIRASNANILVLINPDAIFIDTSIEPLLSAFKQSDFSIIGPKITDTCGHTMKTWHNFPLALTEPLRFARNKFFNGRCLGLGLAPSTRNRILPADWLSGACLFVKRIVIEKAGLFDERYFMFYEDIDYCKRAKQQGFKIGYFPGYTIVHKQGKSVESSDRQVIKNIHRRSQLLYWNTHLPLLERSILKACLNMKILFTPSNYK